MIKDPGLKALALFIAGSAVLAAVFLGCGRVVDEVVSGGLATIQGTVKDSSTDLPLSGVSVEAGGKNAATDFAGNFKIADISAGNKVIVSYSKTGYVSYQKNLALTAASSNIGIIYMVKVGVTATVNGASGGTVSDTVKNASVNLPANGLVDPSGAAYSGDATVKLTAFDPSNNKERSVFPGAFSGMTSGGQEREIESMGFVSVEIRKPDGSPLNLATGKTSAVEIPVPASFGSNAPATIPLWFFDPASSTWKEEGTATLVNTANGPVYQGTVSHFSYWNADMIDDTSYIKGRFMDAAFSDRPVPGVYVSAFGIDYGGMDQTESNAEGRYLLKVKANSTVDVFFSTLSLSDYVQRNVATLPPGETLDLGDFPVYAESTIAAFLKKDLSSLVGLNAYYPNIALFGGQTLLVCQGVAGAEFVQGNGTWGNAESVTTNLALSPIVQTTSTGDVKIVFADINGLEYAEKSGATWNIENIDANSDITFHSFVIDSNGDPNIVYYIGTQNMLYYAKKSGATWTKTVLTTLNNDLASISCYVRSLSLAAGPAGELGVAYACSELVMYENDYLKFAEYDGSSWTVSTIKHLSGVGFASWTASLAFSGSQPMIAAAVLSDSLRLYRRGSGGTWTDQEIEVAAPVSVIGTAAFVWPSLAVDSSGNPALAYAAYFLGTQSYLIKFASYNGSAWTKSVVDSYPSPTLPLIPIILKLTSDNKARIVYAMQDPAGNMIVKIAEMQ